MVSPLRERVALMRDRGIALRVGDHFEKSYDEINNATEAGVQREKTVHGQAK
jgi:hypothetical protein